MSTGGQLQHESVPVRLRGVDIQQMSHIKETRLDGGHAGHADSLGGSQEIAPSAIRSQPLAHVCLPSRDEVWGHTGVGHPHGDGRGCLGRGILGPFRRRVVRHLRRHHLRRRLARPVRGPTHHYPRRTGTTAQELRSSQCRQPVYLRDKSGFLGSRQDLLGDDRGTACPGSALRRLPISSLKTCNATEAIRQSTAQLRGASPRSRRGGGGHIVRSWFVRGRRRRRGGYPCATGERHWQRCIFDGFAPAMAARPPFPDIPAPSLSI